MAAPAGEHDQRHRHHGPHQREGQGGGGTRSEDEGGDDGGDGQHPVEQALGDADLGEVAQLVGHRPGDGGVGPRARRVREAAHTVPAEQQPAQDHEQEDHVGRRGDVAAPEHQLFQRPEGGGGEEGDRQGLHPGQHRRRQGGEQQARPGEAGGHGSLAGDGQDVGQRREPAADDPHQCRQLGHRDAEEPGPVQVLGRGPHGDARIRAVEEPDESGDHQRYDGQDQDVIAGEDDGIKLEHLVVERRGEAAEGPGLAAEERRQQQLHPTEHLGQPDGGHREHEAGGMGEAPDDGEFDDASQDQPQRQAHAHGREIVPVLLEVELHAEEPGHRTERPVGEVDDPVGAVDQDQPDGQQAVGCAEHDALDHDADGRAVG